ncbi:MAG TPA: hypothetical protein VMF06_22210 [Candidatus Limnocylindria bacterium]|jgi:hypothetical protein|nr:hypothetical protein [Candidatus Limnocylindria bacterium]
MKHHLDLVPTVQSDPRKGDRLFERLLLRHDRGFYRTLKRQGNGALIFPENLRRKGKISASTDEKEALLQKRMKCSKNGNFIGV